MSLLTGKRVLLVEDEAVIAFALEDMLHELGCVVIGPAYQLETACTLAEAEAIDVAILDVNLNEARSYAVADILQRRGIRLRRNRHRMERPRRHRHRQTLSQGRNRHSAGGAARLIVAPKSGLIGGCHACDEVKPFAPGRAPAPASSRVVEPRAPAAP
jgi:CheY-like chemotaxis protein